MTSTPHSAHDRGPTAPAHPTTAPNPPTRTWSAGHVVAIVIGCLILLPGLGLLGGGGALALAQAVATDDDGFFTFTLDRIDSDGVAVATTDLWFDVAEDDAGPWAFDWLDVDLRLRVEGAGPTDDVFVGIARTVDVEDYLAGAAYSRVIELDEHAPAYLIIDGSRSIESPLDQGFWTVSAVGAAEQELEWDARGGRWSVVVMNADGSPDVAADVEVGARSGAVTPVAVALIVTGGLMTVFAVTLIVVGARGRRTPGGPPSGAATTPLPPPDPASAAVSAEADRRPTPVG